LAREFDGDLNLTFHLAPPLLGRKDAKGQPMKSEFGGWILPLFKLLARLKPLRGTPLDIFGYSAERKMERALIAQYETDLAEIQKSVGPNTLDIARQLAELPLQIRGFGHVKQASVSAFEKRRAELLQAFRAGGNPMKAAAE